MLKAMKLRVRPELGSNLGGFTSGMVSPRL